MALIGKPRDIIRVGGKGIMQQSQSEEQNSSVMEKSMCVSIFCSALPFLHPHFSPLPLKLMKPLRGSCPHSVKAKGRSTHNVNEKGDDFITFQVWGRTTALPSRRENATVLFPLLSVCCHCISLTQMMQISGIL